MRRFRAAIVAWLFAASLTHAEEFGLDSRNSSPKNVLPKPYAIGGFQGTPFGAWLTCPRGYLIAEGQCIPWYDPRKNGPLTELGCEIREKRNGEVEQTCPKTNQLWVGNVGDFGAPVVSLVGPGPAFVGPVIGVSIISTRRR